MLMDGIQKTHPENLHPRKGNPKQFPEEKQKFGYFCKITLIYSDLLYLNITFCYLSMAEISRDNKLQFAFLQISCQRLILRL